MKRKLKDFETKYQAEKKRAKLEDSFFDWAKFEDSVRVEFDSVIGDDQILKKAYETGKLFFSSSERESALKKALKPRISAIKDISSQVQAQAAIDSFYSEEIDLEDAFLDTIREARHYKPQTDMVRGLNSSALDALSKTPFGISMEAFPDLSFGRSGRLSRSDCFNGETNLLEFCPRNFAGTVIGARLVPGGLFAHEMAHAIDNLVNSDASARLLEENLKKFYPDYLSNPNATEALVCASKLFDPALSSSYGVDKIITKDKFDTSFASAAFEFVSFYAELVSVTMSLSSDFEDYKLKLSEHFRSRLETQLAGYSDKEKLFALDSVSVFSSAYSASLKLDGELQELFAENKKILDSHIDPIVERISQQISDLQDKNPAKILLDQYIKGKTAELLKDKGDINSVDEIVEEIFNGSDFVSEYTKKLLELAKADPKLVDLPREYQERVIRKRFVEPQIEQIKDYIKSQIRLEVINRKNHILTEKAGEIQKKILEADKDVKETNAEVESMKKSLESIENDLRGKPQDQDLLKRKAVLEEKIRTESEKLKKRESDMEKAAEESRKTEEDIGKNDQDRDDTKRKMEERERDIFNK
jgi:hypothetical protein